MASSSIDIPGAKLGAGFAASHRHSISAAAHSPLVQQSLGEAADFVVLGGSPVVHLLSDSDALDDLSVQMGDIGLGSGEGGVQSVSLKSDIERLTKENEQLKRTAQENSTSLKKHVELCTVWREQMNKMHERDATMIEEARQETLKLQDENNTLRTCLDSAQKKLEDAIVDKFNLDRAKGELTAEVGRLKAELAECHDKLEDWDRRAEEVSFVHVEGDPPSAAANDQAQQQEIERLTAQIEELNKQLQAAQTAEGNAALASLESEVVELKALLDDALKARLEAESLRTQLITLSTQKDLEVGQIKREYDDLLQQISLDKATFDEQREKKIVELGERLAVAEKEAEEGRRMRTAHDTAACARDDALQKLGQVNAEVDALRERIRLLTDERNELSARVDRLRQDEMEVSMLKEREVAFGLLQNDQASQIEAFREALRTEQYLRQKVETDYANLLQTWQNFEHNQPVMVEAPGTPGAQGAAAQLPQQQPLAPVDQATLDLLNAEKLRLETEVRQLRETINDLQAQNVRLIQERQMDTVQRAGMAPLGAAAAAVSGDGGASARPSGNPELRCPLCRSQFGDQFTLIQHAGVCENETGSLM